ncbi:hypothetical protein ASD74_23875 [Rhizobium sp. Root564]|nr:hypothetical protein ASD74_23875 [Rhizobium sp. Root564]
MTNFFIGVAIALVAVVFLISRSEKLKAALSEWATEQLTRLGWIKSEPIPAVIEVNREPERAIELPPPDYGNIRPLLGEELDPDEFGPLIHEFPEIRDPATRFEDFNRRLFLVSTEKQQSWSNTTEDDFATKVSGFTIVELLKEIRIRLRPRYPVIVDTYGYWGNASRNLEHNPDYTDDIVETYLAIPEDVRPVVVSFPLGSKDSYFMFIRYGFADFYLRLSTMQPHQKSCLELVLAKIREPREEWLWFSVARMRQAVVRAFQEDEKKRRELEAAAYLSQKTQQAKRDAEHQNRFVALFRNRISVDNQTQLTSDATTENTPVNTEAAQ